MKTKPRYHQQQLYFANECLAALSERARNEALEVLAELLLAHFPDKQAEALAHLDFAIEEFGAMKMQPSLERSLRHKGLLHA